MWHNTKKNKGIIEIETMRALCAASYEATRDTTKIELQTHFLSKTDLFYSGGCSSTTIKRLHHPPLLGELPAVLSAARPRGKASGVLTARSVWGAMRSSTGVNMLAKACGQMPREHSCTVSTQNSAKPRLSIHPRGHLLVTGKKINDIVICKNVSSKVL